jgi:hypothetical protein
MTKKLMALMLSLLAIACGNPITGPSDTTPTYPSANGTLPMWLFDYEGHLVHPDDGTYEVYFGNGVGNDPEVSAYAERVLAAANLMYGVRFVRTSNAASRNAFIVDPSHSKFQGNNWQAFTALEIERGTYVSRSFKVYLRSREVALTSSMLHELGHFLFGTGHSDVPGDTMGLRAHAGGLWTSELGFSSNEMATWDRKHRFSAGTTP